MGFSEVNNGETNNEVVNNEINQNTGLERMLGIKSEITSSAKEKSDFVKEKLQEIKDKLVGETGSEGKEMTDNGEASENTAKGLTEAERENIGENNDLSNEQIEEKREYLTSPQERVDQTPREGARGNWEGERGDSKFVANPEYSSYNENKKSENIITGQDVNNKLNSYGMDGVEYKNGFPNFDKCSETDVKIDMTSDRDTNFRNADKECAKKWNAEGKDGKTDWTSRDVENYRKDNYMSWHEKEDKTTCQMIDRDIHGYFGHAGGRWECDKAENVNGGVFDE